jgi:protein-S-isoprenylcysteine O-methyltransferase Ste14
VLADSRIKQFTETQFAKFYFLYRLIYNLIAIIIITVIVFILRDFSNHNVLIDLPEGFRYLSWVLIIFGAVILSVAIYSYNMLDFMGINQLFGKAEQTGKLITTGLNSVVRHPIYFALILMLIGISLLIPTDLVLLSVLFCFVYLYIGTKLEECRLVQIFGDSYNQYQQKVKMFIPFVL